MGLYPEAKTSALDLLKKQSTINEDFQSSNNQLKFSIASLLFNDQIPIKKPITLDYQKPLFKPEHHSFENNNCLDLSCFTCKSSIKSWFNWCNLQKQQNKVKSELNTFNVNSKFNEPILNQQLNNQLNSQLDSQINQQLVQQISSSNNRPPITSSITNQQINSSSLQLASQHVIRLPHQTLQLNSNKHKINSFNQTSAQINSYLNSLNNATNSGGGKMTQSISNKKKRVRTIFSPEQLERLELEFEQTQYMVGHDRLSLAAELNLSEVQVKVWFQNRRIKQRRTDLDKKHNLIS